MVTLETVGLVIAVLIVGGRFLDSEYIENSTKDAIRVLLIRMYVALDDLPKRLSSIIGRFTEKMYERPEIDVYTGKKKKRERSYIWRIYYFIFMPGFSVAFAYLSQYVFKEEDPFNVSIRFTKAEAWWWGLLMGIILAITGPLILAIILVTL